jgi:hypothetical protein
MAVPLSGVFEWLVVGRSAYEAAGLSVPASAELRLGRLRGSRAAAAISQA